MCCNSIVATFLEILIIGVTLLVAMKWLKWWQLTHYGMKIDDSVVNSRLHISAQYAIWYHFSDCAIHFLSIFVRYIMSFFSIFM